ncbi:hypothetical protein DL95DRAFT_461715 [Leptodontidium sp. 2 PMI_412]|nr:hypothetical protein DL95DRAFT_461715 [Leptodontidium sp. 2 PMI_412]
MGIAETLLANEEDQPPADVNSISEVTARISGYAEPNIANEESKAADETKPTPTQEPPSSTQVPVSTYNVNDTTQPVIVNQFQVASSTSSRGRPVNWSDAIPVLHGDSNDILATVLRKCLLNVVTCRLEDLVGSMFDDGNGTGFFVLKHCLRRVIPALKDPFVYSDEEPAFSNIAQRL